MIVSLIAAMGSNRVIGVDNRLPWRLPADMQRFRRLSMGKPIIMGRKTHESIGKPLPGRTNIVLTRCTRYEAVGCLVVHCIEAALQACGEVEECMVIGGANVYEQTLPLADRLYLTRIHQSFEGGETFPPYACEQWRVCRREEFAADEANPYAYTFLDLARRN